MIKDKNGKILCYTFEEIKERYAAQERWEKAHPILAFFKTYLWRFPVYVLPEALRNAKYKLLYFYQRNTRGFSDYDYFDTGNYICQHVGKVLEFFAENTHGYPVDTTYDEFTSKVKRIANAFKTYAELDEKQSLEEDENINAYIQKAISEEQYHENSKAISLKYETIRGELCKTMAELFEDCFISKLWD